METQSRNPTDLAVDDGGKHLALQPRKRRMPTQVEMSIQPSHCHSELEIRQHDLSNSKRLPVTAFVQPERQPPYAACPLRVYRLDTSHLSLLPLDQANSHLK